MKINTINPIATQGRIKATKIYDWGKIKETYLLDDGKTLQINSYYNFDGKLENKLFYLRDKAGKWLKSVLNIYENGKKVKQSKSYAK